MWMARSCERISRISQRTINAIKAVTGHGVKVILATARPPRSMRELYEKLELNTYQINYNGALIHDPIGKRNVHHQPLSSTVARKVVKLARSVDKRVVVSLEILDKWYTDHVDETLPTETSRAFNPDFVGPLEAFLHVPVTKLMLLGQPAWLEPIREEVRKRLAGHVAMAVSDPHLIQVVHPTVDKATALARIAEHYKIPAQRVMAVGDAPNDVGMLRWAGLGVALENAWEQTRAAADVVAPANDADGVAFALRHYVLES